MSEFTILRHGDIREAILDAEREEAVAEHAAAVALWAERMTDISSAEEKKIESAPVSISNEEKK